jgi:hypothetical protein
MSKHKLEDALKKVDLGNLPDEIKGLKGLEQGSGTNLAADMADVIGLNDKKPGTIKR